MSIKMTQKDEKAAELIKKRFSHQIYVQPHVFSFLQTLSIVIPIDVKDINWDSQYVVMTKKFHSKNRNSGFLHFVTDETTAKAINDLLRKDVQYMFPDKKGLPFDEKESILTIKGIPLVIRREDDRFHICRLLFGDKENFGKQWDHDQFISQYRNTDEIDNLYTYLYPKARHLNKDIGIDRLILVEKKTIGINPTYFSIFSE